MASLGFYNARKYHRIFGDGWVLLYFLFSFFFMLDGSGALAAISREVPQDTKRLSTRGAQACEEHKSRFFGVSFPEVSIDVGISNFLSCTLWLWLPLINCKVQSATVSRGESKDEKLSKCTANAPACRCSSEVPTETYFFFFFFFPFLVFGTSQYPALLIDCFTFWCIR